MKETDWRFLFFFLFPTFTLFFFDLLLYFGVRKVHKNFLYLFPTSIYIELGDNISGNVVRFIY